MILRPVSEAISMILRSHPTGMPTTCCRFRHPTMAKMIALATLATIHAANGWQIRSSTSSTWGKSLSLAYKNVHRLFLLTKDWSNDGVVKKNGFSRAQVLLSSTVAADGSEYSSRDSGDSSSDDDDDIGQSSRYGRSFVEEDDTPTIELQPVPRSKNSGNRFVAILWDQDYRQDDSSKDANDLHNDHVELTEDHVMFCRKRNLYNETFNTESMVDILWSLPILSCDLKRVIGQAMCLESTQLGYVRELLTQEPITKMLTSGDAEILQQVPLYRWRHIRDYSLRIDDGRFGYPCMCLALDHDIETLQADGDADLRRELHDEQMEYLIRSQRVIAAGPLYFPSEFKDDPSSIAIGDLILFNAKNLQDAIDFTEDMPTAHEGLYRSMRVHFYNQLDITGKFVSEDPLRDTPCSDMKEAMEYWGYPVGDDQTPWLNW